MTSQAGGSFVTFFHGPQLPKGQETGSEKSSEKGSEKSTERACPY